MFRDSNDFVFVYSMEKRSADEMDGCGHGSLNIRGISFHTLTRLAVGFGLKGARR
jgi:hypothetical protein